MLKFENELCLQTKFSKSPRMVMGFWELHKNIKLERLDYVTWHSLLESCYDSLV
jgi:hypothetical protein